MSINTKMVSELRDKTNATMDVCKRALVRTNGDISAAEEEIRVNYKNLVGNSEVEQLRQRVAELEAAVKKSNDRLYEEREIWDRMFGDGAKKLERLEIELLAALEEAIDAVRVLHGPVDWETYRDHSPEMKRWQAAIASVKDKQNEN